MRLLLVLDEKPHGLGTQRESGGGECRNSDDLGLRSPVIQKTTIAKKRYTLTPTWYVVARVEKYN